ncbi:FkbM family methyltransferase [Bacillus rhizoplanae]|uniref:FkbM family methyltransferase n=1 Tax=Bacillus rhizoplanae TaxID=2880966 RepID=UPI003D20CEFB
MERHFIEYNPQNTGAYSINLTGNETVKILAVDTLNIEKPNLVKIDVEGFEYDVIQGIQNIFKSSNPVLWVEIFPDNYFKADQFLEELGYMQIDRALDNYMYVKPTGIQDF